MKVFFQSSYNHGKLPQIIAIEKGKTKVHTHNSNGDLRGAFYLNFSFTTIEIVGGIWTNSVAILSDACTILAIAFLWACLGT